MNGFVVNVMDVAGPDLTRFQVNFPKQVIGTWTKALTNFNCTPNKTHPSNELRPSLPR